jgi:hypothetical protein
VRLWVAIESLSAKLRRKIFEQIDLKRLKRCAPLRPWSYQNVSPAYHSFLHLTLSIYYAGQPYDASS